MWPEDRPGRRRSDGSRVGSRGSVGQVHDARRVPARSSACAPGVPRSRPCPPRRQTTRRRSFPARADRVRGSSASTPAAPLSPVGPQAAGRAGFGLACGAGSDAGFRMRGWSGRPSRRTLSARRLKGVVAVLEDPGVPKTDIWPRDDAGTSGMARNAPGLSEPQNRMVWIETPSQGGRCVGARVEQLKAWLKRYCLPAASGSRAACSGTLDRLGAGERRGEGPGRHHPVSRHAPAAAPCSTGRRCWTCRASPTSRCACRSVQAPGLGFHRRTRFAAMILMCGSLDPGRNRDGAGRLAGP